MCDYLYNKLLIRSGCFDIIPIRTLVAIDGRRFGRTLTGEWQKTIVRLNNNMQIPSGIFANVVPVLPPDTSVQIVIAVDGVLRSDCEVLLPPRRRRVSPIDIAL